MPWYAQLQIFKKLEIRHFGNKPPFNYGPSLWPGSYFAACEQAGQGSFPGYINCLVEHSPRGFPQRYDKCWEIQAKLIPRNHMVIIDHTKPLSSLYGRLLQKRCCLDVFIWKCAEYFSALTISEDPPLWSRRQHAPCHAVGPGSIPGRDKFPR